MNILITKSNPQSDDIFTMPYQNFKFEVTKNDVLLDFTLPTGMIVSQLIYAGSKVEWKNVMDIKFVFRYNLADSEVKCIFF